MENKKTLILSIVGVLVLVIAVVGVSFAMYSFTGTGTRENVIKTGTVSLDCEDVQTITLTNEYPKTDEVGSQTAETLECNVTAVINGAMTINYEVGFDSVTVDGTAAAVTDNTTYKLGTDDVKFNITKDGAYLLETGEKVGVALSTRADVAGTMTDTNGNKVFNSYYLDKDTFTASGNHKYVIKAWVADTYDLSHTTTDADGVHTNNTTSQTISFKLKVVGAQA